MTRKTIHGKSIAIEDGEAVEVETEIDVTSYADEVEELPPLFEKVMWKNVKEVYKCLKCDTFRNMEEKDEFILHILTHFQDDEEKEAVLNRLLKELN